MADWQFKFSSKVDLKLFWRGRVLRDHEMAWMCLQPEVHASQWQHCNGFIQPAVFESDSKPDSEPGRKQDSESDTKEG